VTAPDIRHGGGAPGGTIGWVDVQGVIADWVIAASGLPEECHLWANQDEPRTAPAPYIMMTILWEDTVGSDAVIHRKAPDATFVADASSNELAAAAHGRATGDGPVRLSNADGALPGGLAASTDYWVIRVSDDALKLASSRARSLSGTAVDVTTVGTGTHTLSGPITASVEGPRVLQLQLECFADDVIGSAQPQAILDRVVMGAHLPSVAEALIAARVAVGRAGRIVPLPGIEAFALRAAVQVPVHVAAQVSEPGYLIERVEFSGPGGISRVVNKP
jgi:hypothetical protein